MGKSIDGGKKNWYSKIYTYFIITTMKILISYVTENEIIKSIQTLQICYKLVRQNYIWRSESLTETWGFFYVFPYHSIRQLCRQLQGAEKNRGYIKPTLVPVKGTSKGNRNWTCADQSNEHQSTFRKPSLRYGRGSSWIRKSAVLLHFTRFLLISFFEFRKPTKAT